MLPEKAAFQLQATAERGDAVNDFGPQIQKEVEGRTATLKGKVGDGPTIHLTASRGSISVRKEGTLPERARAPAASESHRKAAQDLKETEIKHVMAWQRGRAVLRRSRSGRPSLAVLFLVNVLNFYDRQALGAVLEPLRREFHLSDAQLGALTTVFTVLYAVAGLPLGRLADTVEPQSLLAIGVAVWAGLTGLGGLAASYAMLLATRLGVGIGEAVCAPAATSWIGDLVPPERRARAMAGFMMAVPVGVMLSFAVTGPVAQAWGWRVALALAALPALLLVPALLWLREPARAAAECGRMPHPRPLWPAGFRRSGGSPLRAPSAQFRALQLFHVPAGFSDALSRPVGGAGRPVDRHRLGRRRHPGRGGRRDLGDRIIRPRHNGRLLLAAGAALGARPWPSPPSGCPPATPRPPLR